MTSLYQALSDIVLSDPTVYSHLRKQAEINISDIDTAVALIRDLSAQKQHMVSNMVKAVQHGDAYINGELMERE